MAMRIIATPHLPAPLCREIGRIITRWAYLENYIQHMLRTLLGLEEEEGRLTLREPKLTDRLEMITDLAHLYGLKIDRTLLKKMSAAIITNVEIRDLVAHGVWSYDQQHQMWAVTVTKGSWEDQKIPKTERKKKINPEGLLTNIATMQRTIREIDALIASARTLHAALIEQIAALREKHPQPSDRLAYHRARRTP